MGFSKPYSVSAFSVAPFNPLTNLWGTPVSAINLQSMSVGPEHDTDLMKIFGANEEALSVLTHIITNLTFGGLDWASLAVMAGMADESSGGDLHINDYEGGGEGLPYFGAITVFPLKGGQELHVYLPKNMLNSYPPLDIEQNKFALPQMDMTTTRLRLDNNDTYKILRTIVKATKTAIPTDFNVAFAGMVIPA